MQHCSDSNMICRCSTTIREVIGPVSGINPYLHSYGFITIYIPDWYAAQISRSSNIISPIMAKTFVRVDGAVGSIVCLRDMCIGLYTLSVDLVFRLWLQQQILHIFGITETFSSLPVYKSTVCIDLYSFLHVASRVYSFTSPCTVLLTALLC